MHPPDAGAAACALACSAATWVLWLHAGVAEPERADHGAVATGLARAFWFALWTWVAAAFTNWVLPGCRCNEFATLTSTLPFYNRVGRAACGGVFLAVALAAYASVALAADAAREFAPRAMSSGAAGLLVTVVHVRARAHVDHALVVGLPWPKTRAAVAACALLVVSASSLAGLRGAAPRVAATCVTALVARAAWMVAVSVDFRHSHHACSRHCGAPVVLAVTQRHFGAAGFATLLAALLYSPTALREPPAFASVALFVTHALLACWCAARMHAAVPLVVGALATAAGAARAEPVAAGTCMAGAVLFCAALFSFRQCAEAAMKRVGTIKTNLEHGRYMRAGSAAPGSQSHAELPPVCADAGDGGFP